MLSLVAISLRHYLRIYQGYAIDFWVNMGPAQYGMILVGVFVLGYLMMRSAK